MNHGEMCVNSLLDHLKRIPYADSLVTRVQVIITSQKECKYSSLLLPLLPAVIISGLALTATK